MDIETEKIIKEQLKYLPEEMVTIFANPKTNEQILEIGKIHGFSVEQLEILQTETSLLMLGLTHPDEYQNELKDRLNIQDEELINITKEIYKLAPNEIIEKLKEIYQKTENKNVEEKVLTENKPPIFDPMFLSMPKNVQKAIASSNWKEKLYNIAEKYKLPVSQMGVLEEITIKVMRDEIHPDKYEGELASKIMIAKEDISNLVNDVNEDILKNIRELLKTHWNEEEKKEEIPIPPYANTETKVETLKVEETPKPVSPIQETTPLPPKNIIEEKLKSATVSDHTISDYSSPKINSPSPEVSENNPNPSPKSLDPYREVF